MTNSPENTDENKPIDHPMRDDYLAQALLVVDDPNILVNIVSRRVKQLKRGNRALIESLEKLLPEDIALREIIERKISYELPPPETAAEIEFREGMEREHYRFRRPQHAAIAKAAAV